MANTDEALRRAFAAYFRTGGNEQPSQESSEAITHEGLQYVVLRNVSGLLAVYRVRNDGMLKRLKRWPHSLK